MPEPGNTMTPIGITASIWSLRRNGAALAWRVQSGLKAIWATLRALAQAAAMRSAPLRAAAVEQHQAGMLGMNLVEPVPDGAMVVEVETAGEGYLGAGGQQDLGLAAVLGGNEVAAVDHRRREGAVVDHRPGARAPG